MSIIITLCKKLLNENIKLIFVCIIRNMAKFGLLTILCIAFKLLFASQNWADGTVKYPIIFDTDFDDVWFSRVPTNTIFNTSYLDDALYEEPDTFFIAVRFHHIR